MFVDEARIFVASGGGGDGVVHFRREKYIPRGGPDGGDGGKGGDVILEARPRLGSLVPFRGKVHHRAVPGKPGGGNRRAGKSGVDLILGVPCGTIVVDEQSGSVVGELMTDGQRLRIAKGGRGGRGNARYATPSNQAPRMAERGEPGEERWLQLELRLIADIGIVGVPNAGKSTLLAALTRARPKIGAYPFTTLQPNLGVAQLDQDTTLVLADIPGLIEGAHSGVGLGTAFLRHIQRTRVLIHLLDGSASDPLADYSQVNAEMALFDPRLAEKPQVVAVNKMDLPQVAARWAELDGQLRQAGVTPLAVSVLEGQGLEALLQAAARQLEARRSQPLEEPESVPAYTHSPLEFAVSRESGGDWRVRGTAIERAAAMTYWEYEEPIRRFQRLLERLGVERSLREAGIRPGDMVHIGEYELEWSD